MEGAISFGKFITSEGFINNQSYRRAGVDIDAGNALVEEIKPLARTTQRAGAEADLGGFGALFDPRAAGFKDPVLVSSTDGVGTKLKIAQAMDEHATVGVDLVAMCANDVVVQGAEPLFFLDYFATGRLDGGIARSVIAGIAEGCREAGCALIGGETAEMPGMYPEGVYDLAGFCVGAAERGRLLSGKDVAEGDKVLGLASSGAHANGFSLIRRLVEELGLDYRAPAPFAPEGSLGQVLLEPTRIYVKSCLSALRGGLVRALSHITGGGLLDNIPRVLPPGLAVEIDTRLWPLPRLFVWLAESGKLTPAELARTFNCGIGMAAIVAPEAAEKAEAAFMAERETVIEIGRVVPRPPGGPAVILQGAEETWPA